MRTTLSPEAALIYVMVIVSASDAEMSDAELHAIGELVKTLPAFEKFDAGGLIRVAQECSAVLQEENGLDNALKLIREALPANLRETAYALGLEIALTHRPVVIEELRILDRLRHALALDRLAAAALERGAQARFNRVT